MKITAGVLSSAVLAGMFATGVPTKIAAATEHWNDASQESTDWSNWKKNWAAYSSQYEHVSLTPGADETKLNYAWYSKTAETPKVRISTRQNMDGATEFTGAQTEAVTIDTTKYFSNKVNRKRSQRKYQLLLSGISGWKVAGYTKLYHTGI